MSLIEIRHLKKIYRTGKQQVNALDGVDLCVEQGDLVAVVGASGSGKSTLMNILGCLDVPTHGSYLLNGTAVGTLSINALSRLRNREIGFIFQSFCLISSLSALENVELPLLYRGMGSKRCRQLAMQALERVGLQHRAHHRPGQLSGGQQQRVAIARAIAASPTVLLADEPTGNLDSKAGKEILDVLLQLHREGCTVIVITHDEKVANQCRRVVTVSDGRIVSDLPSQ